MNGELLRQSVRDQAEISLSRSGGPGGQNVNKLNTKVTLRLSLDKVEGLSEAELERSRAVLASRLREGALVLQSSEERSQRVNLERAYARAEALIASAARIPKKRRPTRPGKAARERRLAEKRARSELKQNRRETCLT
jgi:ribosome-associated protein